MKENNMKINILPESDNMIYEQRETGITHTPFQWEMAVYHAIKEGNQSALITAIEQYMENGFVIGKLSGNSLRQMKYWAVATISVAIHYAILGGLDETDAFNLSDVYICRVDEMNNMETCVAYLKDKAEELVEKVVKSKEHAITSPIIRKCMHYIHIHLHERLTIAQLAERLGVSRDYLSILFKKETGSTLHSYIMREKLEASKAMLLQGIPYHLISYNLAFCSETHYITCFKREYGITPGNYKERDWSIEFLT